MKKITLILSSSLFILFSTISFGQEAGEIDHNMLQSFSKDLHSDPALKTRMNAVSANDIQKLALNRKNLGNIDNYFSNRIESKGVTDQKSTGRCWLFTGLNVMRAKVIDEKNMKSFSFSHNYNFFFDQLEKSNLFLEGIIATADKPMDDKKVEWLFKNAIGDGGQWTGVVDIIQKYGVVPSDVFPESFNSENTRWMSKLIRRKLKEDGLELRQMIVDGEKKKKINERKVTMLSEVYKILVVTLGEPPHNFEWRFQDNDDQLSEIKSYTPISFYEEFVNIDLGEYIMFMNDPSREYGKLYEIDYDRHTFEGGNWKYINLEIEKIKELAKESIIGNDAMYFSCDVGKQLNSKLGHLDVNNYDYGSVFGIEFGMDKKQRIQTFESGSSHGMTLIAVDIVDDKATKWLLENSWGSDSGFEGHLVMTDKWFDEYMFRVVIHKKYIDSETLKILDQEAIQLPPWDPMFSSDN